MGRMSCNVSVIVLVLLLQMNHLEAQFLAILQTTNQRMVVSFRSDCVLDQPQTVFDFCLLLLNIVQDQAVVLVVIGEFRFDLFEVFENLYIFFPGLLVPDQIVRIFQQV